MADQEGQPKKTLKPLCGFSRTLKNIFDNFKSCSFVEVNEIKTI